MSLPRCELRFESTPALLSAWARHVAEGSLLVTGLSPEAREVRVDVVCGERHFPDNQGKLVRVQLGVGSWVEVTPSPELASFFSEQRGARPRASGHQLDLTATGSLADAWEQGLATGHCFLVTDEPPALRSRITLTILVPGSSNLEVEADVLHRVLSGPRVGVGLQVTAAHLPALAALESLIRTPPPPRRPKVLVIDDEALWRSTYVRLLKPYGVELVLANDGRDGLQKLIEHFFELDLVVLDLHMPELDGRGLIDRIRRLGGERGLHLILVSAAPEEELAGLGGPQGANEIFSKLQPLQQLEHALLEAIHVTAAAVDRERLAA